MVIYSIFSMYSNLKISLPSQFEGLALEIERGMLLSLSITEKKSSRAKELASDPDKQLKTMIYQKLEKYFSSALPCQSIPIEPQGTSFEKLVWDELIKIPLGETRTYGEIATKLNSSAQAVGNACRKNPIQLIIPCHRVISAKGIGGYAGQMKGKQLEIKRWLLNHEGVDL